MHRPWFVVAVALVGCAHPAPPAPPALRLDRVVLFGNGIGHFERRGALPDRHLRLVLRPHEVDDVIKTLTVVDADGKAQQVAAVLPSPDEVARDRVVIDVELTRPARDLIVSYAVPTAAWKTTYRLALPERADQPVLFQAWALVDNLSPEPWTDVALALATGAPLSFATDLRSPHFVPRPDATGALVTPTATAVVASSASRGGGDHDGIPDELDRCPDADEDVDGWQDDDGCPDPDDDHDRIADADDRCPHEPETYNGIDDDDGCPDRGRVIASGAYIQVLDKIFFGAGAAAVSAQSGPILDAIAATLAHNPEITRVRISGHAATDEHDPWALSARRAAAVRTALIERGARTALVVEPFGATLPVHPDAARNRRVEFEVERSQPPTRPELAAGRDAAPPRGQAVEVAGTARWALTDRVSVPAGASTLVSVLSEPLPGGAVLLFRPEPGTPGSATHPYRAARVELPAKLSVEPGPVAVFADGSFAGEAMLARTAGGQVTYLPYALDGGTTVTVATRGDERPHSLVAIARGVATVQNAMIRTTRYTIAASATAPGKIFLEHRTAAGYELGPVPPGSERGDGRVLLAVPIVAGQTSTVEVEERQPVTRELHLLDDAVDLAAYVDGSDLPPAVRAAATAVATARAELGALELQLDDAQTELTDASDRAAELERSLVAIAKLPGAPAVELRARLVKQLGAASARSDRAAHAIAARRAAMVEARIKLETAIAALGAEELAAR